MNNESNLKKLSELIRKQADTIKINSVIKKYARFDQQKALGVLERYGNGNFEEIMDYEYPSVRAFHSSAITYVSMKDRPKFKKSLEEEFNEKIASISDTLFKKQHHL